MISLLGTSFGAASPWLLLALPCALGFLIYIFRVRGSSTTTIVSSLLFLKHLPQRPVGKKTFVPPLQFWLELAIISLLILAAAGLFSTKSGKHVAVVIDSSLSMGALYGTSGTRLEQAKRMAALDITQSPTSSFSVFSSSGDLDPLSQPRDGAIDAAAAAQSVPQSYRRDDLQAHITSLASDPSYDAVWVYTDHELRNPSASPRLVPNSLPIDPTVQTNAWIQRIEANTTQIPPTITTDIGYVGAAEREARVDGACFTAQGAQLFTLSPQTLKLSSARTAQVVLSTPNSTWDYCNVHVRLQDASLFDSLPLDNEGWIAHRSSQGAIDLHSALSAEQLGLSSLPTLSVTKASNESASNPAVYHRMTPQELPTAATLVVLPPTGPLPWGGASLQDTDSREISRWDESHPILTYVKPSLILLSDIRPLECPPTATPILFSSRGPLLCAGESFGSRYVISGFELFPFEGKKNPTMSILTLNVWKWLFQSALSTSSETIPTSIQLEPHISSATIVAPQKETLQAIGGSSITPRMPGILSLVSNTGAQRLLSLNAFEPTESDLSQPGVVTFTTITPSRGAAATATDSSSLGRWLSLLALVVVGADLFRRLKRRLRWSDA